MLAILRLGREAYSVSVAEEIKKCTSRTVSLALLVTLGGGDAHWHPSGPPRSSRWESRRA
jgi:hypothetical protein